MENEKIRMLIFALIASLCLFYILTNSAQPVPPKAPGEQIANQKSATEGDKPSEPKKASAVKDQSAKVDGSEAKETETSEEEPASEVVADAKPEEVGVVYAVADTPAIEEKLITVETDQLQITFTSKAGSLLKVDFKDFDKTYEKNSGNYSFIDMQNGYEGYKNTFVVTGLEQLFEKAPFEHTLDKNGDEQTLTFRSVQKGVEVQKIFVFHKSNYDFKFNLKVINHREEELLADTTFIAGMGLDLDFKHDSSVYNDQIVTLIDEDGDKFAAGDVHFWSGTYGARQGLMALNEEKFVMGPNRKSGKKHDKAKVVWASMKNRYFALIVKPSKDDWTVYGENMNTNMKDKFAVKPQMVFEPSESKLAKGQSFEENFKIFAGPMKDDIINADVYEEDMFNEVVDYGFMFPRFIKVFNWVLNMIISVIGHNQYWLGIILLTLMVRLSMFPITRKSSLSQAKLQAVTPKMKALKEKNKGNPKKLNEEMMKLYREEGVNPFSSCLPMFIQMPIFIGLYWTFNLTFEVRFTSFLWINDLAVADHLFSLGRTLPILKDHFNLLPILYAVINYLHMSSMPVPQDDMQAQQQKIMRYMFPVMMLLFFYNMPAALVLYFIVSGTWSIVEQKLIKKKIEVLKAAAKK